jgi:CDP-paratose 2-epimerase
VRLGSRILAVLLRTASGRSWMNWNYEDQARKGDHIWWISDIGKIQQHYPDWSLEHGVPDIIADIAETARRRIAVSQ